jgi:hypothetical protein
MSAPENWVGNEQKKDLRPGDYGFVPVEARVRKEFEAQARAKIQGYVLPPKEVHTISETLDARGKRYGVFTGHAEVTQRLKNLITCELTDREKTLAYDQQEALDMICHKIGRIINGDADYDDSWIDIAGYAQLVADRLRGIPR